MLTTVYFFSCYFGRPATMAQWNFFFIYTYIFFCFCCYCPRSVSHKSLTSSRVLLASPYIYVYSCSVKKLTISWRCYCRIRTLTPRLLCPLPGASIGRSCCHFFLFQRLCRHYITALIILYIHPSGLVNDIRLRKFTKAPKTLFLDLNITQYNITNLTKFAIWKSVYNTVISLKSRFAFFFF